MIIKYLTIFPSYESPKYIPKNYTSLNPLPISHEDFDSKFYLPEFDDSEFKLQQSLEEALYLYHKHANTPLIQQATDILSITPLHMREKMWHYIDNIESISIRTGYAYWFGFGTHIDIMRTSGECKELSLTDTAYLLNDSGKTIEMICKGEYTPYDSQKVEILKKYINGKYNQEELLEKLDNHYKKINKENKSD